eukprot:TRINITY_DN32418_c0_g1_i1.p1 TRINITY_DN32418_c0_g1~~TRINITY_DN32418_c0_g1_i1.p1  ORF type:complete len:338 (-),score=55.10 TRINITY_DN32418_c0_g1_i1:122-1135(-)
MSVASLQMSPWTNAKQDENGEWQLPYLPCEIAGLADDDPKNSPWRPGEYTLGVDNVISDENGAVREYSGQKMWEGDHPPREWNPKRLPQKVQNLLKVPHMPGQPTKETFARMKALEPRLFEDKHFNDILRDLPEGWPSMVRRIKWAEGFGINTEEEPAEWAGQEDSLVPAVYATPRPNTLTICVGMQGSSASSSKPPSGTEYDYLELLYAKDQEGKVIQVMPFACAGVRPASFWSYSFIPPVGTTSITPYAAFKIRGVWRGDPIQWDAKIGSEDMMWFTDMDPKQRKLLADESKLEGKSKYEVESIRYPKRDKEELRLWPDNSWEGNAAKARLWDKN